MKLHTVDQQSPEWFALRAKRMSASHAQAIGNQGKGLETYILTMMAEYYSTAEKEHFSNVHTDRGNELEPIARNLYSLHTGEVVEQVGFVEHSEHVGCSPDGLTSEGCIEIKCPDDVKYFKHLLDGDKAIDTAYVWQIQMVMLITRRKWCDYIAYNPNYDRPLFIHRFFPDEKMQEKLTKGFAIGQKLIEEIEEKYKKTLQNNKK